MIMALVMLLLQTTVWEPSPERPPGSAPDLKLREATAAFDAASRQLKACLSAVKREGMLKRTEPSVFEARLKTACLADENGFKKASVAMAVAAGYDADQVLVLLDSTTASGHRVIAAEQRRYLETGEGIVPR